MLLWKIVYRNGDRYHVDAVRLGFEPVFYEGDSVAALDYQRDLAWLERDSLQALDVERFRWFSQGYIALDPRHPDRVMDLRYSLLPNEIRPLWSIELSAAEQDRHHVAYLSHRGNTERALGRLWGMLLGRPLAAVGD
jgi:inner membrane protein